MKIALIVLILMINLEAEDDSGFSSWLSSVKSSILSELLSIKENKKRKQLLKRLLHLGLLEHELRQITFYIYSNILADNDHSIIVFRGLQAYFDRTENGETPPLQECMRYEWLRLQSFSSYTGKGCPVRLAQNGFYHLSGNETRCFCCHVSYSNWTYTDNVHETHIRISPNCSFVNVGDEPSGNISIEADSVQNEPDQVVPGNTGDGSMLVQPSSQRLEVPVNHGSDVPTQVTQLTGAPTSQQSTGVQQSSDEPVSGNRVVGPTHSENIWLQVVSDDAVYSVRNRNAEHAHLYPNFRIQAMSEYTQEDRQLRARKENSPRPSEGAVFLPQDTESLKEENNVLKRKLMCNICMNNNVSVVFLPCGHLVCCEDCARNRKKCPECGKKLKEQVRTWM